MDLIVELQRGSIRCVYDESIALSELGRVTIERASHVEPDAVGEWWADLAPINGPRLGPYDRRSDAIVAEIGWLNEHALRSPEAKS